MFRPRIIPVLLLKNKTLVKSVQFRNHKYIGDPINAVRLFNDFKADELIFLDIMATKEDRCISLEFVRNVGEEANMPFAVGGGIKTIEEIKKLIAAGAERVIINSYAATNPDFIKQASETFGSSTISVCIDVKKNFFKKTQTWILNGRKSTGIMPEEFAMHMESKGAGEIIVQSIEKDGTMKGYDLELIKKISLSVSIPVVALGGAGTIIHVKQACNEGYASGVAAGSLFVFQGTQKGILINYPEKSEMNFNEKL